MAHWRALVHPEGVPPREENTRCWVQAEHAAAWLDEQMLNVETKALREGEWNDASAAREARRRLDDSWGDLHRSSPDKWIKMGPAFELLSANYVIEGCACEREAALDVADVLDLIAQDAASVRSSTQATATLAAIRARTAGEQWTRETGGGAVPTRIIMLGKAADDMQQRAKDAERHASALKSRAERQRKAASSGSVTVCGVKPWHQGGGCGVPARVYSQNAYNDSDDCMWCGKSDITRQLGD